MIDIGPIKIGKGSPLAFILGPCVMETEELVYNTAKILKNNCPYPFIFKSSFDKANRSSIHSFRGLGLKTGLSLLKQIKKDFDLLVTTDVHLPEQVLEAAEVCDLIQIPAFLSRQTDLILESAKTQKPIHVKKGQFIAPHDMKQVVIKIEEMGNKNILLGERGFCFGYNNLVVDMRSIPIMKETNYPVCFDATHSVQLPGGLGNATSGERKFLPTLALAAISAGADAIFIETHPNPKIAKSDAANQWPLQDLMPLLDSLNALHEFLQGKELVPTYV